MRIEELLKKIDVFIVDMLYVVLRKVALLSHGIYVVGFMVRLKWNVFGIDFLFRILDGISSVVFVNAFRACAFCFR
jgi:hypothetical protein